MLLESSGGSGTAGAHWEDRVIEGDYMNGFIIPHDAIYSNFTFKLFEDTGWYLPIYSLMEEATWGKN